MKTILMAWELGGGRNHLTLTEGRGVRLNYSEQRAPH
jgi:hypothetical protein